MARTRTANISGELITNTLIVTSTGANVSNAVVKTGDTMTGNLVIDGANLNVNGLMIVYGNDPDIIQNMYSNSANADIVAHEFRVDNGLEAQLSYHIRTNEMTLYGTNANSILQLGAGGQIDVLRIGNTGNVTIQNQNNRVVIGSTTPGGDAQFSVVSNNFTAGEIFLGEFCPANTDGSVAIGYVANGTSDLYGFIRSRHSVDLGLGAGAGNHLYIKQGGNVGIATTSPSHKLHVEGDIFTPNSLRLGSPTNTRLSADGSGEFGINFNTSGTSAFIMRIYDVGAPALNNAVFQVARTTGNTKIGFDLTNPNSVAANLHVQTNSDRALHVDGPISGPVYLTSVNNNIGPYDMRELALRGQDVTIYTGNGAKANAIQRAVITSAGNVGIGTASPSNKLDVWGDDGGNGGIRLVTKTSGTASYQTIALIRNTGSTVNDGWFQLYDNGTARISMAANAARGGHTYFNTGGGLTVGGTTDDGILTSIQTYATGVQFSLRDNSNLRRAIFLGNGYYGYQWAQTIYSDGGKGHIFANAAGTEVGSIVINNASTAFNTTSDYRLKDNPLPLTGSGEFIDALQPKTWTWKSNGERGAGFIAHEVATVSPSSVTGEKDATRLDMIQNEDGTYTEQIIPSYQSLEYGSPEFIANIVAELQSLRQRVAILENK